MLFTLKLQDAFEEGRAEGRAEARAEARAEGRAEIKREIAIGLLDILDNDTISKSTGFSLQEVEGLRQKHEGSV